MYPGGHRAEDWGQFFPGSRLGAGWSVLNHVVGAALIQTQKLILKERNSCEKSAPRCLR